MKNVPAAQPSMIIEYGSEACARVAANSSSIAGMTTTTRYIAEPPIVSNVNDAARRTHAYVDSISVLICIV